MRDSRGERRRLRAFLAVGIAATAISLVLYATEALDRIELSTVDARFSVRGEQALPEEIVIVAIDDTTTAKLGRYPFSRIHHADVIEALAADGARTIAYDVEFIGQTVEPEDRALFNAVRDAGGVVLAAEQVNARTGVPPAFGGPETVESANAVVGRTSVFPADPGGIYRRMDNEVDGIESFPLVVAERATGKQIDPDRGLDWIDFRGPPGTFPIVSFSEVAAGQTPPGYFEDKIVVVGATKLALGDVHGTSFSGGTQLMTGPEIHANAIATILDDFPLRRSSGWLNVVLIVSMGMFAAVTGIRLAPRYALLATVGAGLAFVVGVQLAFNSGLIVPFSYPMLAFVLAGAGTLGVYYVNEVMERVRVRDLFARFVPESVVDDVLAQAGSDLRLGGVRREVTVLFSDLRGFTSFSEGVDPERVIDIVNRYLSEMSEAILANGGTIAAYIGDGIMAIFGAPLDQPDHADRALATAKAMAGERLDAFNHWVHSQGIDHEFRMGVGLNTGEVMAGNVGSERRLDYTAIGDTVNTASRIEGMTKGSGHQVFIADATRDALKSGAQGLVYVDEMPVRGREKPVKLWSIPS